MKHSFRTLSFLLALACLALLLPRKALADKKKIENEKTQGDFSYVISNGKATITNYHGYASHVFIPDTIGGKTVTQIGVEAFESCKSMRSVTVPDTVRRIDNNAFWECSNLREVDLPVGLQEISYNVFSWCVSLEQIVIPDGVRSLGKYAFSGCSGLKDIQLPSSLTFLGDGAFSGCTSLKHISIPAGIKSIGTDTFANCSSLETVLMTKNIQKIDSGAFRRCAGFIIVAPENSKAAKIAASRGIPTMTPELFRPPSAASVTAGADAEVERLNGYVLGYWPDSGYISLADDSGTDYAEGFHTDGSTEFIGFNAGVQIGDLVEVAFAYGSGEDRLATEITLIAAAKVRKVTGKLLEISTGFVELRLSDGKEKDFFLTEDSELVNYTEDYEGRKATIQYVNINRTSVILRMTMN